MKESELLGLYYIRGSYEDKQWYVVTRKNNGIRFCVIRPAAPGESESKFTLAIVYDLISIFIEYRLSTNQQVHALIKRYECF